MKVILVMIIAAMTVFLFYVRKVSVPESCDTSTITKPFYKGGVWLTAKLVSNNKIKSILLQKNSEKFYLLKPGKDIVQENYMHLVSKVSNSLLFLTLGCVLVLLISFSSESKSVLASGNVLKRNEFPKGDYIVELDVTVDGESFNGEKINVSAREYSKKEISANEFQERTGLKRATFFNLLSEYKTELRENKVFLKNNFQHIPIS